jgi:hypothetical protein
MKVNAKSSGNFEPHEAGVFRAVCVDVTPLEKRDTQFGIKEEFRLVFETDAEPSEEDRPRCVWSRGFTPSLSEKANLRKFLRQWFGRDLNAVELAEFDTETLIGMPASVVVVQEDSKDGDKVYANIVACTPYKGDDPLKPTGKFVRKQDREKKDGAKGEEASYRKAAGSDEAAEAGDAVDKTKAGEDWTKVKVHIGKHAGVELRDLDQEAIEKLLTNWIPVFEAANKPSADDKRLAAALKKAEAAMSAATTTEVDY